MVRIALCNGCTFGQLPAACTFAPFGSTPMRYQTLAEHSFLTLKYDMVGQYLHALWHGEQTDETIRAGYEAILQQLVAERCTRLLDDHYDIKGIWLSQADWFAYDWYPRAVAAGLQHYTAVYSQDFFSRRSTQTALSLIPGGLLTGFIEVDTARQALLAQ